MTQFCRKCHNSMDLQPSSMVYSLKCMDCRTLEKINTPFIETVWRSETIQNLYDDESLTEVVKPIADEKCSRCGHLKASYYELQIRSADEPATVFYTCENKQCGFKWREG